MVKRLMFWVQNVLASVKRNIRSLHVFFFLWWHSLLKYKKIFTHITDEEKIALYKIVRQLGKTRGTVVAVEIGSYLGSSSCFLAAGLYKNKGLLYCIDTWNNDAMTEGTRDTFDEFSDNTKAFKEKIIPVRGWSYDVFGAVQKNVRNNVDILFIDGDHSYAGCKKDWMLYSDLFAKDAIVVFHDTGWADGVVKVIKEFVAHRGDKIVHLPNMQAFIMRSS